MQKKFKRDISKWINRPIVKLYWSNFLKIHFLLQNIMNDILPYYKFSDILLHLYNSFSVYCFSWLVNMGCGTKLSPNIFFLVVKMFFCHKEDTHKEGMSKDLTKLVWCTFNFAPWFWNYYRKENYTIFLKIYWITISVCQICDYKG